MSKHPTVIISAMIWKTIIAPTTNPLITKLHTKPNRATIRTAVAKPTRMVTAFLRTKQLRPHLSSIQKS